MAGRTSESHSSLLERATRMLEALPPDGSAIGVAAWGRAADLPLTTAARIAAEWERVGMVDRVEGGFAASARLWELGERAPIARRLREVAGPELTELHARTGENAHMAILVGTDVLYLAKVRGPRAIPTLSRVGVRHPAHATGVGRAILAALPPDLRAAALPRTLRRITPFTIDDHRRLEADLDLTAERGWALTRQEMTLGNASIAVALERRSGLPRSAIGVVTHLAAADERRLLPLLLRAAESIDAKMDDFH